jgi:hypothetical protein
METSKSLVEALRNTREALDDIKKQLRPFLLDLVGESRAAKIAEASTIDDKGKKAQAAMAVALAMGTLRYMGARLRGLDKGRTPEDPLRKELNSMRKLMVTLQKKIDETKAKAEAPKRKTDTQDDAQGDASKQPATKRHKATKG